MEKSIITFSANEQNLQKTGGIGCYASDTVSYIEARFALGENWSGYDSVRAVWFNDYKTISTVLDSNGICIVPHEVLTNRGKVMVNLVGSILVSGELSDRLTTFPCEALKVSAKAKINGSETAAVTPSQFEQFVEVVKGDAGKAESEAENALASAQASEASALRASGHAQNAQSAETSARAYAQSAQNSATNAENAKDDAIDARDEIRSMRANAETLEPNQSATASYSNGVLSLGIPKGDKGDKGNTGDTGSPAGFGTVSATVDANIGTPSVEVTASGADTAKNFAFAFHNLKGQKGDKGDTGTVPDLDLILPTDTASGDIISIPDGQPVIPVQSLKVQLDPIQDLHGYDKPWSAGAGKNKYNPANYIVGTTSHYNKSVGEVLSQGGGASRATSTGENPIIVDVKTDLAGVTYISDTIKSGQEYCLSFSPTATTSANCRMSIYYINDNYEVLYRHANYTTPQNILTLLTPTEDCRVAVFVGSTTVQAVTVNNLQLELGSSATAYAPYENICPIDGRTKVDTNATSCEEYEGKTYTTDFVDSQGDPITVYGCTIDQVSGELKIDTIFFGNAALSELTWQRSPRNAQYEGYYYINYNSVPRPLAPINKQEGTVSSFGICTNPYDHPVDCAWAFSNGTQVQLRLGFANDPASDGVTFKEWLAEHSEIQLAYKIESPQVVQLTPQQIDLLKGTNTIWSDGPVTMIYNADVQLWVLKQLGASGTRTLSMTRTLAKSEDTDDTKSDNIQLAED